MGIVEKINRLKKEKNAVILAHNYQRPEIQDIADFVGDSLGLSVEAGKTNASTIVFCGVDFMAQTAKIINPQKRVLIPEKARCPMAMMLCPSDIVIAKEKYNAPVVLYINTIAECKSLADYVCTSANAVKVVNSIKGDTIIFGPDENLASYVQRKTKKRIIPIPEYGLCPTHHQISLSDIETAKSRHENAEIVIHPETRAEIHEIADFIGSTEQMIKYCKKSKAMEFIVGTENGILHRMEKEAPSKKFYPSSETAICPNMKMITLEKVLNSLENNVFDIELDEETIAKAKKSIDRMLDLV